MAFHPLRTFQKNRKFWMASILLVCMATFVLCTGMQGDFGHRLMEWFGGRGGSVLVTIDGRDYYPRDLDQIRKHRDVANEFMRKATLVNIDRLGRLMEEVGKRAESNERTRVYTLYTGLVGDLSERMNRPRYFEGGTKFDDVVDFIVWRNQAERLGINLGIDGLRELIQLDVHGRPVSDLAPLMLDTVTTRRLYQDVRSGMYEATDATIEQALMDEYRVRIAQLALAEVQWRQFQLGGGKASVRLDPGEWGLLTRKIITPEQFRDFYKKNRSEMEIALVPLRLAALGKEVKVTPNDLKLFFDRYKEARYHPESETPGFERPAEVKIEWVSADADMPFYKKAAAAALAAELVAPPLGLAGPSASSLSAGTGYLGRLAAWEALLQRIYSNLKNIPSQAVKYEIPGWLTPEVAMPIISRKPPAATEIAALVGGTASADFNLSALAGFQGGAYLRQAKTLAPVLDLERKTRTAIGATLILSATMDSPAGLQPVGAPLALAMYADQGQFLPLNDELRAELRERFERAFYAQRWVNKNMIAARDRLNAKQENRRDMLKIVEELTKDGRIEHGVSAQPYNQYEIDTDKALEPLRKSWLRHYSQINSAEGRAGTSSMLKEDDFYKLFFEGEPFSLTSNLFAPKYWPPALQPKPQPHLPPQMQKVLLEQVQRSFERFETAEKPFVFWRREAIPARTPKTFDETPSVRDAVEKAYRLAEARKTIGPLLSKGAEALVAALKKEHDDPRLRGAALYDAARDLAKAQGGAPIKLQNVAQLVPKEDKGEIRYVPYELPRGVVPYPMADLSKHLLTLNDLKAPIKTDHPELDRLNEELFKQRVDGRAVQVVTNKPRTEFYLVAVVTPPQDLAEFAGLHIAMRGVRGNFPDLLMDQAQRDAAQQYRRDLMAQLRQPPAVVVSEEGDQQRKDEQKQEQKKKK